MMGPTDTLTYRTFWVAGNVDPLYHQVRRNAKQGCSGAVYPPYLQVLAAAPTPHFLKGSLRRGPPASDRLPVVTYVITLWRVLLGNARWGQGRCGWGCGWGCGRGCDCGW